MVMSSDHVTVTGQSKELDVAEAESPEEEEEEEEKEGDEEEEKEEEEEEVIIFKPRMKFFSGKNAAGLRIRAEPSLLVSTSLLPLPPSLC